MKCTHTGAPIRNSSPVNLWICSLQYLVSLFSEAITIIAMLLEIKLNFSWFIRITSILRNVNQFIAGWKPVSPSFNSSTHMKGALTSQVPYESAVINSSHYFAANSHDPLWWFHQPLRVYAYSYLCSCRSHSCLRPWLVCSWCSNWAAVDWLLWGAVRPLKVKTYQSC